MPLSVSENNGNQLWCASLSLYLHYNTHLSAQYMMSKRCARTRALLDKALASGAIATISAPAHHHTDINVQGVLMTTTTPVVQSDPATIILEQHTTEPATTADVASSNESDVEDDGGNKPIPEVRDIFLLTAST